MKIFNIFNKIAAVLVIGLLSFSASAASVSKWGDTPAGLPYVQYEGKVEKGADDPYFLLGNYRVNLFTHVSGAYQLMSGERVWARFNADPSRPDYGCGSSVITIEDRKHELTGYNAATASSDYQVTSGVGFTRYDYVLDGGIKCSRMISVMPSDKINGGNPAFLLTVTFRNTSNVPCKVAYDEIVKPCFDPMNEQNQHSFDRRNKYSYHTDVSFRCVSAIYDPMPQKYMRPLAAGSPVMYENEPMSMFVYSADAFLSVLKDGIHAKLNDVKLRPGQTRHFKVVVGIAAEDVKAVGEDMLKKAEDGQYGAYASMWKSKMPDLSQERDLNMRREAYWNAHVLEASAVYDSYYDETFIPAGSSDTYALGKKTSMIDHIQAALPLCYTDPELAVSTIRYAIKHGDRLGRIADGDLGYGHVVYSGDNDGLLQFSLFRLVSECIRVSGNSDFLKEFMETGKAGKSEFISVMSGLEECFLYLRDEADADSPVFKAMALSVMPDFISHIKASGHAPSGFVQSMEEFMLTVNAGALGNIESKSDEELSYLIGVPVLPVSERREMIDLYSDRAGETRDFSVEYRFLLGVMSFDRIEASGIARRLSFNRIAEKYQQEWMGHWTAPAVFDPSSSEQYGYSSRPHYWALYSYFRLHE